MSINTQLLDATVRDNIQELCERFFPNGRQDGQDWVIGDASGQPGESLKISLLVEKAGIWQDWSTGEGGTFCELIQASRGLNFSDAAKTIAEAIGVNLVEATGTYGPTRTRQHLNATKRKPFNWEGPQFTELSEGRKIILEQWRRYSPEFVDYLADNRLIKIYQGVTADHWAFPISAGGQICGAHCRPMTSGEHVEWTVVPTKKDGGPGMQPFVIGDLEHAKDIHIFESQWDMFTACDKLGIHLSDEAAAICTRGATNNRPALKQLPVTGNLYAWPQNDEAGEKWYADSVVKASVQPVARVETPKEYKDLNDWVRYGGAGSQELSQAVKAALLVSSSVPEDSNSQFHCPGIQWLPLPQYVEDQKGLVQYDTIYEAKNQRYYALSFEGNWMALSESAVRRKLNQQFHLGKVSEDGKPSEVEQELHLITMGRNVEFACSLAGYRRGVYKIPSGQRILVVDNPRPIMPVVGDWNLLEKFIEELLGPEQTTYFIAWISLAVKALHQRSFEPGHALILAGPADCGKTFLQTHVITPLLGGRVAKPYQFMTGATAFNADLFLAEHLMISDESPKGDIAARREFATAIKNVCANPDQRLHEKHKTAFVLRPFWRLTISLNDEPENLVMLPIIEESIIDKLLLFKATRPTCLPKLPDEKPGFLLKIKSELPAFVAYLLNHEVAAELKHGRFGVKHFINSEISAELHSLSPEAQLLDLIDCSGLFSRLNDNDEIGPFTATEVYTRLIDSNHRGAAMKLLSGGAKTTGNYLQRLAKLSKPRVFVHMRDHISRYRIFKKV